MINHQMRFRVTIVLLACLLLFSAGCAKKEERNPPRPGPLAAGGQIQVGSFFEPDTWNPYLSDLLVVQDIGRLIFSGLLIQNDKGEWLADLATDVPRLENGGISPDGLTYTFKLKSGLQWQDGKPLTARDIRSTYDFIQKNRARIAGSEEYGKIQSLSLPDDFTVVIRFSELQPQALRLFPFILPAHKMAELTDIRQQNYSRLPVGCGPFILKEWQRGDSITFVANNNYHRGRPVLDAIAYRIVTEQQIVLSQLKIGEVDVVNYIPYDQLDQIRSVTGINAFITRGLILEHLGFNLDHPLFADIRVRKAIQFGISRREIIEKSLKNAAFIAATDIHPLSWAYARNLKPEEKDLNQARTLLSAAGWQFGSDGIRVREGKRFAFTLTVPGNDKTRILVANHVSAQLRELGIEMRVQTMDSRQFFADILPNRRFEMFMFAWVNGTEPDLLEYWHSRRIPTVVSRFTGKNYAGWRSPEVDSILEMIQAVRDPKVQLPQYYRLQELLIQEVPIIPLYHRAEISAAKRSIENYRPNPLTGNFWNVWEWGLR